MNEKKKTINEVSCFNDSDLGVIDVLKKYHREQIYYDNLLSDAQRAYLRGMYYMFDTVLVEMKLRLTLQMEWGKISKDRHDTELKQLEEDADGWDYCIIHEAELMIAENGKQ